MRMVGRPAVSPGAPGRGNWRPASCQYVSAIHVAEPGEALAGDVGPRVGKDNFLPSAAPACSRLREWQSRSAARPASGPGAGGRIVPVPEGREKIAQGASPGKTAHTAEHSPGRGGRNGDSPRFCRPCRGLTFLVSRFSQGLAPLAIARRPSGDATTPDVDVCGRNEGCDLGYRSAPS